MFQIRRIVDDVKSLNIIKMEHGKSDPKRSPFNMYIEERRSVFKAENNDITDFEIATKASEEWRRLTDDEKKVFYERSREIPRKPASTSKPAETRPVPEKPPWQEGSVFSPGAYTGLPYGSFGQGSFYKSASGFASTDPGTTSEGKTLPSHFGNLSLNCWLALL